jgi:hypothetical protein
MAVASIPQPHYLIWLGLLDKIAKSDVFVVLDDVQYNKRSFQHRTLYSTGSGAKYLSLSVNSKGAQSGSVYIKDITLPNQQMLQTHFKTLLGRYGKCPGWSLVGDELARIYSKKWKYLIDINLELLQLTLNLYSLKPRILMSSSLVTTEVKGALMYELANMVDCDCYLSGVGAKEYMDFVPADKQLCQVKFQDFTHPSYRQSTKAEFQAGTLALEWAIEEPEKFRNKFKDLSLSTQAYRCLHDQ